MRRRGLLPSRSRDERDGVDEPVQEHQDVHALNIFDQPYSLVNRYCRAVFRVWRRSMAGHDGSHGLAHHRVTGVVPLF